MNENEEIIALLKSINKHLQELDASMLVMKKRIDHIDDRIIQEDMDNEAAALMQLEEGYEKPVDPQFEVIFKKVQRQQNFLIPITQFLLILASYITMVPLLKLRSQC